MYLKVNSMRRLMTMLIVVALSSSVYPEYHEQDRYSYSEIKKKKKKKKKLAEKGKKKKKGFFSKAFGSK
jgi:hypothetical protein|tara:strand:+ start:1566 stop:1772 length:207 start_codon:yes stop_codon:yes gene_type:complete